MTTKSTRSRRRTRKRNNKEAQITDDDEGRLAHVHKKRNTRNNGAKPKTRGAFTNGNNGTKPRNKGEITPGNMSNDGNHNKPTVNPPASAASTPVSPDTNTNATSATTPNEVPIKANLPTDTTTNEVPPKANTTATTQIEVPPNANVTTATAPNEGPSTNNSNTAGPDGTPPNAVAAATIIDTKGNTIDAPDEEEYFQGLEDEPEQKEPVKTHQAMEVDNDNANAKAAAIASNKVDSGTDGSEIKDAAGNTIDNITNHDDPATNHTTNNKTASSTANKRQNKTKGTFLKKYLHSLYPIVASAAYNHSGSSSTVRSAKISSAAASSVAHPRHDSRTYHCLPLPSRYQKPVPFVPANYADKYYLEHSQTKGKEDNDDTPQGLDKPAEAESPITPRDAANNSGAIRKKKTKKIPDKVTFAAAKDLEEVPYPELFMESWVNKIINPAGCGLSKLRVNTFSPLKGAPDGIVLDIRDIKDGTLQLFDNNTAKMLTFKAVDSHWSIPCYTHNRALIRAIKQYAAAKLPMIYADGPDFAVCTKSFWKDEGNKGRMEIDLCYVQRFRKVHHAKIDFFKSLADVSTCPVFKKIVKNMPPGMVLVTSKAVKKVVLPRWNKWAAARSQPHAVHHKLEVSRFVRKDLNFALAKKYPHQAFVNDEKIIFIPDITAKKRWLANGSYHRDFKAYLVVEQEGYGPLILSDQVHTDLLKAGYRLDIVLRIKNGIYMNTFWGRGLAIHIRSYDVAMHATQAPLHVNDYVGSADKSMYALLQGWGIRNWVGNYLPTFQGLTGKQFDQTCCVERFNVGQWLWDIINNFELIPRPQLFRAKFKESIWIYPVPKKRAYMRTHADIKFTYYDGADAQFMMDCIPYDDKAEACLNKILEDRPTNTYNKILKLKSVYFEFTNWNDSRMHLDIFNWGDYEWAKPPVGISSAYDVFRQKMYETEVSICVTNSTDLFQSRMGSYARKQADKKLHGFYYDKEALGEAFSNTEEKVTAGIDLTEEQDKDDYDFYQGTPRSSDPPTHNATVNNAPQQQQNKNTNDALHQQQQQQQNKNINGASHQPPQQPQNKNIKGASHQHQQQQQNKNIHGASHQHQQQQQNKNIHGASHQQQQQQQNKNIHGASHQHQQQQQNNNIDGASHQQQQQPQIKNVNGVSHQQQQQPQNKNVHGASYQQQPPNKNINRASQQQQQQRYGNGGSQQRQQRNHNNAAAFRKQTQHQQPINHNNAAASPQRSSIFKDRFNSPHYPRSADPHQQSQGKAKGRAPPPGFNNYNNRYGAKQRNCSSARRSADLPQKPPIRNNAGYHSYVNNNRNYHQQHNFGQNDGYRNQQQQQGFNNNNNSHRDRQQQQGFNYNNNNDGYHNQQQQRGFNNNNNNANDYRRQNYDYTDADNYSGPHNQQQTGYNNGHDNRPHSFNNNNNGGYPQDYDNNHNGQARFNNNQDQQASVNRSADRDVFNNNDIDFPQTSFSLAELISVYPAYTELSKVNREYAEERWMKILEMAPDRTMEGYREFLMGLSEEDFVKNYRRHQELSPNQPHRQGIFSPFNIKIPPEGAPPAKDQRAKPEIVDLTGDEVEDDEDTLNGEEYDDDIDPLDDNHNSSAEHAKEEKQEEDERKGVLEKVGGGSFKINVNAFKKAREAQKEDEEEKIWEDINEKPYYHFQLAPPAQRKMNIMQKYKAFNFDTLQVWKLLSGYTNFYVNPDKGADKAPVGITKINLNNLIDTLEDEAAQADLTGLLDWTHPLHSKVGFECRAWGGGHQKPNRTNDGRNARYRNPRGGRRGGRGGYNGNNNNYPPPVTKKNTFRVLSSYSNADPECVIMQNFAIERTAKPEVTAALARLSYFFGLTQNDYLDTIVQKMQYAEASSNAKYICTPFMVGGCWSKKKGIKIVMSFDGKTTVELLHWRHKMNKQLARDDSNVIPIPVSSSAELIIITGPGVDNIGMRIRKDPVALPWSKPYRLTVVIGASASLDTQKRRANGRAMQKVKERIARDQAAFVENNRHVAINAIAKDAAPVERSMIDNYFRQHFPDRYNNNNNRRYNQYQGGPYSSISDGNTVDNNNNNNNYIAAARNNRNGYPRLGSNANRGNHQRSMFCPFLPCFHQLLQQPQFFTTPLYRINCLLFSTIGPVVHMVSIVINNDPCVLFYIYILLVLKNSNFVSRRKSIIIICMDEDNVTLYVKDMMYILLIFKLIVLLIKVLSCNQNEIDYGIWCKTCLLFFISNIFCRICRYIVLLFFIICFRSSFVCNFFYLLFYFTFAHDRILKLSGEQSNPPLTTNSINSFFLALALFCIDTESIQDTLFFVLFCILLVFFFLPLIRKYRFKLNYTFSLYHPFENALPLSLDSEIYTSVPLATLKKDSLTSVYSSWATNRRDIHPNLDPKTHINILSQKMLIIFIILKYTLNTYYEPSSTTTTLSYHLSPALRITPIMVLTIHSPSHTIAYPCYSPTITAEAVLRSLHLSHYKCSNITRRDLPLSLLYGNEDGPIYIEPRLKGGSKVILGFGFKDKYGTDNKRILQIIHENSKHLRNRFRGIKLPHRYFNGVWPMIYYKKEEERFHIQNVIRNLLKKEKICIQFRKKHQICDVPILPEKEDQVTTTSSFLNVDKCRKHIQKNKVAKDDPQLFIKDTRTRLSMKFCPKNDEDLLALKRTFQGNLEFFYSNYNEYLSELKETALYEISQIFRQVMENKICHLSAEARNKFKYHMNIITPTQVIKARKQDLSSLIHKYPMAQIYDPNISPLHSNVVRVDGLDVLYMNIDGRTKNLLTDNHPIITRIIKKYDPDIFVAGDIGKNIAAAALLGYVRITQKLPVKGEKAGGLAVYAKRNLKTPIAVRKICANSDIIWMEIEKKFIAVGYSRPNKLCNDKLITTFFRSLDFEVCKIKQEIGTSAEVFIIGDLNARMGITTGDVNKNRTSEKLLRNFLRKHDLKIANGLYQYGIKTYVSPSGTGSSIIDYAICSDPQKQLNGFEVDTSAIYNAHRPILIQFKNATATITEVNPIYTIRQMELNQEQEDQLQQGLIRRTAQLKKLIKHINQLQLTKAKLAEVNDMIFLMAIYMYHYEQIQIRGVRNVLGSSRWGKISGEMINLITKAEYLDKTGDPHNEMKEVNKAYHEELKRLQQLKLDQNTEKFMGAMHGDKSKLLGRLLKFCGQNPVVTQLVHKDQLLPANEAHKQHLSTVMKAKPKRKDLLQQEIDELEERMNDCNPNIYLIDADVTDAISATNTDGAPGYDGITQPMMEDACLQTARFWLQIYRQWNRTGIIPMRAKLGVINCISKKAVTEIPDSPVDFRPISLLPIPYKVYERVILKKLTDHGVESCIDTLQGGFRRGRGVLEQIGTLRVISEENKRLKKPLYCALLDIQKAYDTAWRDAILLKLRKNFNIPIELCKVVAAMLKNTKSGIKNKSYVTHMFPTSAGVVQGSVISPALYGVFIDDLIKLLREQRQGTMVFGEEVPGLLYCDDIIILSNTKQGLKHLLAICEGHSIKWQYRFKPSKCHLLGYGLNKVNLEVNNSIKEMQKEEIQTVFQQQLYKKDREHPFLRLVAPLIINEKIRRKKETWYRGRDILGRMTSWSENWFNSPLLKQMIKRLEVRKKPQLVQWEQLSTIKGNDEGWMFWNIKLYGKRIEQVHQARYLGVQLWEDDHHCIVSAEKTLQVFQNKMMNKITRVTKQILMDYNKIDLMDKVRSLKTFLLPLTEVFAQVMPIHYVQKVSDAIVRSYGLALNIHPSHFRPKQLAVWCGIPLPIDRWRLNAYMYFIKMLHHNNHSLLNLWIKQQWEENELPYFQFLRTLKKEFAGPLYNHELIWETGDFEKVKGEAILDILSRNKRELDEDHPMRANQWISMKNSMYMVISEEKLKSFDKSVSKACLNRYFELFYNFNGTKQTIEGRCNICKKKVKSIDKHIILSCNGLDTLRRRYWNQVMRHLCKFILSPKDVYNIEFASNVMCILKDMDERKQEFWQLIGGANSWLKPKNSPKDTPKKLSYSHNWKKLLQTRYKFMWWLQIGILKWVNIVKLTHLRPRNRKKYLNQYRWSPKVTWFPQFFYSDAQISKFYKEVNANENDIIVFTDGSYSSESPHYAFAAGAGIVVFHKMKRYEYSIPMGVTEVLHAEQFAVAQVIPLLERLKITLTHKRLIIFIDNEATFRQIYSSNGIPDYPDLMSYIKQNYFSRLDGSKILIHKVKSHQPEDPIKGNNFADDCANLGRILSSYFPEETPSNPSCFRSSQAHYYTPRCSEKIFLWYPIGID